VFLLVLAHPGSPGQREGHETVVVCGVYLAGWSQTKRKKFPDFSTPFFSHNYTFPEVITTKLKVSPHLSCDKIVSNYITDDISQQNFTQSTVVLRKYSITLKLFYLL